MDNTTRKDNRAPVLRRVLSTGSSGGDLEAVSLATPTDSRQGPAPAEYLWRVVESSRRAPRVGRGRYADAPGKPPRHWTGRGRLCSPHGRSAPVTGSRG